MPSEYPKISLKAARVNAGLTQKEAAKSIGVSERQLCLWELHPGDVKQKYISRLAELYDWPKDLIRFDV